MKNKRQEFIWIDLGACIYPTHVASDTQWELKFTGDKNQALSSIASDAWKQFQLMEHGWYIKDPT